MVTYIFYYIKILYVKSSLTKKGNKKICVGRKKGYSRKRAQNRYSNMQIMTGKQRLSERFTSWLPISSFYKRRLLLLMNDILNDKALYSPFNLRLNRPPLWGGLQFKVGKESAQYRGPVIWTFINRLANFTKR